MNTAQDRETLSEAWLTRQMKLAEQDPAGLRRIALARVASGLVYDTKTAELLKKLVQSRPDDPLPHLIRLYSLPTTNRSPVHTRSADRLTQAGPLTESFQWLCDRHPDAKRDLLYYYITQLSALGASETAAKVLADELKAAQSFPDLGGLLTLVLRSGDDALIRTLLDRAVEFKPQPDRAYEDLAYRRLLLDSALVHPRLTTPHDIHKILIIFDGCLALPAVSPPTTGSRLAAHVPILVSPGSGSVQVLNSPQPSAGTPSQQRVELQLRQRLALENELKSLEQSLAALQRQSASQGANQTLGTTLASQMRVLSQRRDTIEASLRRMGRGFPSANRYLDVDRLNLLASIQSWLKQAGREALLLELTQRRGEEVEAPLSATYRLATVYLLWWGGQKAQATDELQKLCDASPGDHILRLALAQAFYAENEVQRSLEALEQIKDPTGDVLASVTQLRSELRRFWSVTVKVREMKAHAHVVRGVAFSPNGKWLVSASFDRTLAIWKTEGGVFERRLAGHTDLVMAVAWSPQDDLIASAGYDGVRLWSPAINSPLKTLEGHTSAVRAVVFSPDGKLLATAGDDRTIRLWDVLLKSEVAVLEGHIGPILGLAFSPDGKQLASVSGDSTARLWDVAQRKLINKLAGHANSCVAFSPDGQTLATGGDDHRVMLWRLSTGRVFAILERHADSVCALAFSPDGKTLASASADRTIKLWTMGVSGLTPDTLTGHHKGVAALAWSPDGALLASGSHDETVGLWAPGDESLRAAGRGK